jgi:hypothetical protein
MVNHPVLKLRCGLEVAIDVTCFRLSRMVPRPHDHLDRSVASTWPNDRLTNDSADEKSNQQYACEKLQRWGRGGCMFLLP